MSCIIIIIIVIIIIKRKMCFLNQSELLGPGKMMYCCCFPPQLLTNWWCIMLLPLLVFSLYLLRPHFGSGLIVIEGISDLLYCCLFPVERFDFLSVFSGAARSLLWDFTFCVSVFFPFQTNFSQRHKGLLCNNN